MENKITFKALNEYSSIKEFLKTFHVGRGRIEEIRNSKKTLVNGQNASLDTPLKKDDLVTFYADEKKVNPIPYNLKVFFEDENIICVYKEKNLLVHQDGNEGETLTNYVAYHLIKEKQNPIVYPLHRLDFETSGIILFAKNFLACSIFSFMIESHEIEKRYLCFCEGHFKNKKGIIKLNVSKDRHNPNKMIVLKKGEEAITNYKVLEEFDKYSLVEAQIVTGKKHQIRVSFAHYNHPLIGDKLYGSKYNNPLKLEAISLKFKHPFKNKIIEISSNIKLKIEEE